MPPFVFLRRSVVGTMTCWLLWSGPSLCADESEALRLVPFPKEVRFEPGCFDGQQRLVLEAPADRLAVLAQLVSEEFLRAGLARPEPRAAQQPGHTLRVLAEGQTAAPEPEPLRAKANEEEYTLRVAPAGIVVQARGPAGLFYGVQTVRQLVRANRQGGRLRCLAIRDWPALRWRCFQDDLTRGPSATFGTLQQEIDGGAELKMNLFTYYMEYQYAFRKHPKIGPPDGSLAPDELAELVRYARPRQIDILGNQQSFGHFQHILKHPEYAELAEVPPPKANNLSPVREETYGLLDDLYSEICPYLPLAWFNVCCDETWTLGQGQSQALAAQIGVGGVYVRHVRRVHDLLKDKYGKRMMMWGDIILKHPDKLDQIPKDTIMITWKYAARDSYEDQIVPFAQSGYEFFVAPGVDNWNRILPNFANATQNIQNFVRDGVKHGTLGMLNTEWKDDGESLRGSNWHGYAWGAECAWNASTTPSEAFNRRIGAVLFGEPGDHFGRAIELLGQTASLPEPAAKRWPKNLTNKHFWQEDFVPKGDAAAIRTAAEQLLAVVRPAIEHLRLCQAQATVHAPWLEAFVFGARRMELIGQRMLDGLEVARLYREATQATSPEAKLARLAQIEKLVRTNRDAHEALGREFTRIWLAESKPYALDWTMTRYKAKVAWYEKLAARVAELANQLRSGQSLPAADAHGFVPQE